VLRELDELRNRAPVFRDRRHAGGVLARMLEGRIPPGARLLAIPAGGVPVAAEIARALGLAVDVAVVSKITPSWNTEVGYGAVAFDGRVRADRAAMARLGIGEAEERTGTERTRAKVRRRVDALRRGRGALVAAGETAVLVDDGLASGLTMAVAVEAVREAGAGRVVVAVPTGSARALGRLAALADDVYCANVRTGWSFAVADAYEQWADVDEAEVARTLEGGDGAPGSRGPGPGAPAS
jgi:predicted phosphoribosyltransferase